MLALDDSQVDASRISILGTDINADILREARAATYETSKTTDIAEELEPLDDYAEYIDRDENLSVRDLVRRMVEFEQHDLIRGEPKRDFDLVFCRNLLIYIDSEFKVPIFETIPRLPARGRLPHDRDDGDVAGGLPRFLRGRRQATPDLPENMSLYELERTGDVQELIRVIRESDNDRVRAGARNSCGTSPTTTTGKTSSARSSGRLRTRTTTSPRRQSTRSTNSAATPSSNSSATWRASTSTATAPNG